MYNQLELTDDQLALAVGGLGNTGANTTTSTITANANNTNLASANQTNVLIGSTVVGSIGGASISQQNLNLQKITADFIQLNS
jgi:hypothetical protein